MGESGYPAGTMKAMRAHSSAVTGLAPVALVALVALAMVVTASCGGGTALAPAPGSESAAARTGSTTTAAEDAPAVSDEERATLMIEDLTRRAVAAGADCDRFAGEIDAFMVSHGDDFRELIARVESGSPAPSDKARWEARQRAAFDDLLKQADGCMKVERARSAFAAFDAVVRGS